ncbi:hypothetical protein [Haliangium sp.]|uniref:hypothetical protein n=1 Tax=Haliangium sp. TaxID=2663208 RepID=UPI003D1129A3
MSSATQTENVPQSGKSGRLMWALGTILLLGGWLSILQVYHWHLTSAVVFLFMGWAALLATTKYLIQAGLAAAEDTGDAEDDEDDEFWRPRGHRDELLREKRALIKALKEIEFDHEMGKMSDADAEELSSYYRHRAIELIKALEFEGEDETLSVQERIEREVRARLAVSKAAEKADKAKRAEKAEASEKAEKAEASEKAEKAEASEKAEKSEASEKAEESEAEAAEDDDSDDAEDDVARTEAKS